MEMSCIFPHLIQTITLHRGMQPNAYEYDAAYEQGKKHPPLKVTSSTKLFFAIK